MQDAINNLQSGDTLNISCQIGIGSAGISVVGKTNITVQGINGGGFTSLGIPTQTVPGFQAVMFLIQNCTGCGINNLQWNGNNLAASPFGFTSNTNTTLAGATITDVAYPANAAVVAVANNHNRYVNNTISHTGQGCWIAAAQLAIPLLNGRCYVGVLDGVRGMWIGNAGADKAERYPTFSGNNVSYTGATGIASHPIGAIVTNNVVNHSQGAGIKIEQGDGGPGNDQHVITGNILTINFVHGLQLDDRLPVVDSAIVHDNVMSTNNQFGIYAPAMLTNSEISNNTILDNHQNGTGGWMGALLCSAQME